MSLAACRLGMKNTSECKACGKKFKLDVRNLERQSYCSRQTCQRQRRCLRQRLRRHNVASKPKSAQPTIQASAGQRGLQAASVISEADMRQENPVIIGLISMITGVIDFEDRQPIYRRLWVQGAKILFTGHEQGIDKPNIISMLDEVKDQIRGNR